MTGCIGTVDLWSDNSNLPRVFNPEVPLSKDFPGICIGSSEVLANVEPRVARRAFQYPPMSHHEVIASCSLLKDRGANQFPAAHRLSDVELACGAAWI